MLALTVVRSGMVELREMPQPVAAPGCVVIRVSFSGVSVGTEMLAATGRLDIFGKPPFVAGYQASGEVVELGDGVETVSVGEWVCVFGYGSHAQYVQAEAELVYRLPTPALAKLASLWVQPSVAANALNQCDVKAGEIVLVVGQGLIGQMTAQLARLRGARVIATDVAPERLAISARYCADDVIDANEGSISQQMHEHLGHSADVVLETTGSYDVVDEALQCLAPSGRFVFAGYYPEQLRFTFAVAHEREVRAYFPTFVGTHAVGDAVLRLIASGKLVVEPLISHLVTWRAAADTYARLFTPDRQRINGIVIDWEGARPGE